MMIGLDVNADEPWFDMEKCAICKTMAGNESLMAEIDWESHNIPNGVLSISVIPEEHKAKMEQCHNDMKAVIAKMEGGEAMELCQHCMGYGALMAKGAKMVELDTIGGQVSIFTSDDEAVVKEIQAHAKRSKEEFKKMMAQPAS